MSSGIVSNTVIENNVKGVSSTYVKCDCGTELLEFQAYDRDPVHKDDDAGATLTCTGDLAFALRYYGPLSRSDVKYGYNDFYTKGVECIKNLIGLLKEITDERDDRDIDTVFYDETLPYKIEKKYGRGGICVVHYKDDIFTYIRKHKNLEKKRNASWEIVLRKDNLKAFVTNIEQIVKKVESSSCTGWIVASPEQIKEN